MKSSSEKDDAYRVFCDVLEFNQEEQEFAKDPDRSVQEVNVSDNKAASEPSTNGLVCSIRQSLVGRLSLFTTPYNVEMPLIYADWTATGRPLYSVEKYIEKELLPFYGNTHTTTSITGIQSTCFQHEARQIVAECVNAKITGRASEDCVLFTGTGATEAVHKLVQALGLASPLPLDTPPLDRPLILVGPWEHHSNLLPWRESCGEVVIIHDIQGGGGIDIDHLTAVLVHNQGRRLIVGAFSAASNVTGVVCDVDGITAVLHRYGALACWDCATAAPHMKIDMNPLVTGPAHALVYKDAMFLSGHKFLGGPGSPGVLVVKRRLLSNAVPTCPGGGTVFYVTPKDHRYLRNREEREEAGTPDVIGAARLGLAMRVQRQLWAAGIGTKATEAVLAKRLYTSLRSHPSILVLGPQKMKNDHTVEQLPIISFLIKHEKHHENGNHIEKDGKISRTFETETTDRSSPTCGTADGGKKVLFLHPNFVCALLNDLFGVQSRGGCMCAGPHAQNLLGISAENVRKVEEQLLKKQELLRPGFTRLSLSSWDSDAEVEHILFAVHFVASHGSMFLPFYRMDPLTGEWRHASRARRFPERRWLGTFSAELKTENDRVSRLSEDGEAALLKNIQDRAYQHLQSAKLQTPRRVLHESPLTSESEELRWFACPWESNDDPSSSQIDPKSSIIDPSRYTDLLWRKGEKESVLHNAQQTPDSEANAGYVAAPTLVHLTNGKQESLNGEPSNSTNHDQLAHTSTNQIQHENGEKNLGPARVDSKDLGPPRHDSKDLAPPRNNKGDLRYKHPLQHGGGMNGVGKQPTFLQEGARDTILGTRANGNGSIPSDNSPTERVLFPTPPKALLRTVGQAIQDWSMICEGDRLCLGLSGGKDSLALLHVLLNLKKRSPVKFELSCATVDPQTPSFDPSPLIIYCKELGVTYHYLSDGIVDRAKISLRGDSLCSFCSRAKRGLLYACCREHGYNKLVLAQHLDDLAESFMMAALHNGQLRTMKAHYLNEAGDVAVIRPLIYAREVATRDFSTSARLPVINENCPACFEQPKERARVKEMLSREEAVFPDVFKILKRSLLPLMDDRMYTEIDKSVEETLARGSLKGRGRFGGPNPIPQKDGTGNIPTLKPVPLYNPRHFTSHTIGEDNNNIVQNGAVDKSTVLANISMEDLQAELDRRKALL